MQLASTRYAWFVVVILMLAYVFSFIDRQILSLMVGPIRHDLGISDTVMSLLMGLSFALFYTVCGIPLGRLADSRSRRGLIVAGLVCWSLATAACGLAQRFWHLFLFRVGVGVGEAALSPAAYSMIVDYFPPERRAIALSVYSMGIFIGSGLAFLVGGMVVELTSAHGDFHWPLLGAVRPWQSVFFIVGFAGLLFSLMFWFVREPPRTDAKPVASLAEVLRHLRRNQRTVVLHNLGFSMLALATYAALSWVPSFFVRTHGWSPGTAGMVYGLLTLILGSTGIVTGGWLADRWRKQGQRDANIRVGIVAAACGLPFGIAYALAPNPILATLALAPSVFFMALPFGAAPAAIQEIVPPRMRGQASAVYLFAVTLVGLGIGPTAVALITDYVFHDDRQLRHSLWIVCALAQFSGLILLRACLAPYRDSLSHSQVHSAPLPL